MSIGKRHGNTLFCRWNMYKERGIFRCHVHFQRVSLDITHKDRETCHMVRKTWNRVRFKLYWLFQAISSNDVFRVSNRLRFPCWTPCGKSKAESFIVCSSIWWQGVEMNMNNVGKTMITHPFGNGLYHLFMVIWGMVYYCFTLITVKGTKLFLDRHLKDWSSWEWSNFGCPPQFPWQFWLPLKPWRFSLSGPDRDGRRKRGSLLMLVVIPSAATGGFWDKFCGPFENLTSQNPAKVKEAQSSSELERFKLDPTCSLQNLSNLQLRSIKFPWQHSNNCLAQILAHPGHKRLEKETKHAQRIPKKTSAKSLLGCAISWFQLPICHQSHNFWSQPCCGCWDFCRSGGYKLWTMVWRVYLPWVAWWCLGLCLGKSTKSDMGIHGYGSIPIDTFLVGWTSIYQLFGVH